MKAEVQRRYGCIQGGAAHVLAASVFLNGTVVAFSLYLEVWLKYIYFFSLKHCLASWTLAESVGWQPWGAMPGPSAQGQFSPCTLPSLPGAGGRRRPSLCGSAGLSCEQRRCSTRHLGETTRSWAPIFGYLSSCLTLELPVPTRMPL